MSDSEIQQYNWKIGRSLEGGRNLNSAKDTLSSFRLNGLIVPQNMGLMEWITEVAIYCHRLNLGI